MRRRIIRGVLLLGGILAVILALLAVAGGAAAPRIDLGASSGGITLLIDVLTVVVVAASFVGLVLIISSIRVRKAAPMHIEPRRRSLASVAVLVGIIVLLTLLPDPRARQGQGPTVGLPGTSADQTQDTVTIEPDRALVVTSLVAAAILAAMAALARRTLDPERASASTSISDDESGRIRQTVLGVRTDLEGVADPREAILLAYERLRIGLRDAGVEPQLDDTPRRVVHRALTHPHIPPGPLEELVSTFEEARFSTHSVGATHRERALDALTQIEHAIDHVVEPT